MKKRILHMTEIIFHMALFAGGMKEILRHVAAKVEGTLDSFQHAVKRRHGILPRFYDPLAGLLDRGKPFFHMKKGLCDELLKKFIPERKVVLPAEWKWQ